MSLSIQDLKPKNFNIVIKGVELECLPLKLHHTLTIASVGDIFQNIKAASPEDIKKAEKDVSAVIKEVIPSIDFELDGDTTLEVIGKLMNSTAPSDNEFLAKNGVKLNADPKAERVG